MSYIVWRRQRLNLTPAFTLHRIVVTKSTRSTVRLYKVLGSKGTRINTQEHSIYSRIILICTYYS